MTLERIESSSGKSPALDPNVAAAEQVAYSKMSPGQGFGQENYVFLPPPKNQEQEQEQEIQPPRKGLRWAEALGFTLLAAMAAALLISIIWSAAPGYNPVRFSGNSRSPEQAPQPNFNTRANCSQEQEGQRCR
jgi:hypothetical protein